MKENIDSSIIKKIKEQINNSEKIVIIGHFAPDGDAAGGSLALYNILKKLKANVNVIMPTRLVKYYKWMPAAENIISHDAKKKKSEKLVEDADLIFCVDFNSISRVENLQYAIKRSNAIKIMLDHHPEPEMFCDYTISDTTVSSASEIVYEFICSLDYKSYIDKDFATCIYTGIMTDTLNFTVNSSKERTFEILAKLISYGVDKDYIYDAVNNNFSENRMRLQGYVLYEKMKVLHDFKAAYMILTNDELEKFEFKKGDNEGFVNMPLSIKGINVSCFFIEKIDHIKVSLRSVGENNVNKFAREYFNGGGHKNAAGGKLFIPISDVEKYVTQAITDYFG